MDIPKQVLEKRQLTVTSETNPDLVMAVQDHNKLMTECATKMREIKKVRLAFRILNITVLMVYLVLALMSGKGAVVPMLLTMAAIVGFVMFGVISDKFYISSVISVGLLFVDLSVLFFVIGNFLLSSAYIRELKKVAGKSDYPKFREVVIIYEKRSKVRGNARDAGSSEGVFNDLDVERDINVSSTPSDSVRSGSVYDNSGTKEGPLEMDDLWSGIE